MYMIDSLFLKKDFIVNSISKESLITNFTLIKGVTCSKYKYLYAPYCGLGPIRPNFSQYGLAVADNAYDIQSQVLTHPGTIRQSYNRDR